MVKAIWIRVMLFCAGVLTGGAIYWWINDYISFGVISGMIITALYLGWAFTYELRNYQITRKITIN